MKQVILTFDGGGLCNRLFPFANALASCVEHGRQLVNPTFGEYAPYFVGTTRGLAETDPQLRTELHLPGWRLRYGLARRLRKEAVVAKPETERLDLGPELRSRSQRQGGGRLWVDGLYVLDDAAFIRHGDLLRRYFTPVDEVAKAVETCLAEAREGVDVVVGVHIRQGDYRQHAGGILYYETAEYAELMRKVVAAMEGKRLRFLIASNVPQDPALLEDLDWQAAPGTAVGDLYALAACDTLIGAPSTYSQWASFYGQVPRYVHDRKGFEARGEVAPAFDLEQFQVHRAGFGRYAPLPADLPQLQSS